MAEYHVGCGAFGIYAGTLSKPRKDGSQLWRDKSEVTDEAIRSVAQYLLEAEIELEFTYHGKRYLLSVQETEEGDADD